MVVLKPGVAEWVSVLFADEAEAYTGGTHVWISSPTMSTMPPREPKPKPRVDPTDDDEIGEKAAFLLRGFSVLHAILALLFACLAVMLVVISAREAWSVIGSDMGPETAQLVIEAVGVLAAAVVALQISQTITEEEVIRSAHISAPTRVRRFLSRFMVVVVVALAIEALVATFRSAHEDSTQLLHAAAMVLAVGGLLAGWGIFIRMNRYAEELEPEAMEEAKEEDEKLK